MSDQEKKNDGHPGKRFRITRRVKPEPVRPYSEQVLSEVDQDDADKGTPAMNREVTRGCSGCLNVTLLIFLIMIASIVATFFITRKGV